MTKKKTRKIEEPQEDRVFEPKQFIRGSFISCQRVKQGELKDIFLIKLSAINTIYPLPDNDAECIFYTYKDCCYHVPIPAWELRRAIDSFVFKPEEHWESFGY